MEETVSDLRQAGIAVELLSGYDSTGKNRYGIRLRTFGRKLARGKMIIAEGKTFEEALINAVGKAEARRWEDLDWASVPWETPTNASPRLLYGL